MAFGQEINDQTFAIGKAEFIKNGNTLSDDQFEGQTFDYIISNPPSGREWKNEKAKVEAEAKKGFAGRFGAGLPAASDGQMLFLMTAISKQQNARFVMKKGKKQQDTALRDTENVPLTHDKRKNEYPLPILFFTIYLLMRLSWQEVKEISKRVRDISLWKFTGYVCGMKSKFQPMCYDRGSAC